MNSKTAATAEKALRNELTAQSLPLSLLGFLLPQAALESAGFTSKVSSVNNFTGIKHSANGFSYDSGIKPPEGGPNYAGYKTPELWAKDYLRIIKRMGAHKASTSDEFLNILKAKGYFGASLESYKKAFNSWLPQLKKMFASVQFQSAAGAAIVFVLLIFYFLLKNER